MDIHKMLDILHKAQETYGYANQVTVAAEECLELALILQKYPRYPTHTDFCEALDKDKGVTMRERVVEEAADVVICLNHLYTMFNVTPEEVERYMDEKLERLQRWLNAEDKTMYQTTVDRDFHKETVELLASVDVERKPVPVNCDACKDGKFFGGCSECRYRKGQVK
jgi:hypothetical protein